MNVIPCKNDGKRSIDTYTFEDFNDKLLEEVREFYEAMQKVETKEQYYHMIEEGVDVITVVITTLSHFGVSDSEIEATIQAVNLKNRNRGYLVDKAVKK